MLASTFTRKAAGEILERVLVRLAEGATDAGKARELGRDAHPSLAQPDECRRLLGQLLTDLHQMNVGTLDAFFVRVARSFFQELGMAPRWTIADEPTQDRLRTDAVQAALLPLGIILHSPLANERYRIIPAAWYTPLHQQMILIKGASIEARQLFEFMLGSAARAILIEHGFIVPDLRTSGS